MFRLENGIQIFSNPEFGEIRTVAINGEPWFVGKDVAEILGYSNPSKAVMAHVDDEDKTFVMLDRADSQNGNVSSGQSKTAVINESGLYSLILSSKLEGAKKFKRWVTSEVLPAIRKTGGYIAGQDEMSPEELMSKALLVAQKTLEEREKRLAALKTQKDDYKYNDRYIEGFVVRDANSHMIKLKLAFYKYWKRMRNAMQQVQKRGYVEKTAQLYDATSNEFYGFMKNLFEEDRDAFRNENIISLRNKFYEQKGI